MEDKQHFVAELVLKWALDEMRYAPEGKFANAPLPTLNQLKRLCRSNTLPIWEFLVNNTKSKRTVDNYRGNVEWMAKMRRGADLASDREDQRRAFLTRRDQLNASISSGQKTAEKLNYEIEKLKAELRSAETMEKATKSQMMDVDVKKTLLDGFEIQLEDEVSLLTEYTRKFKALFLRFQERCKIASADFVNVDGVLLSETQRKIKSASDFILEHMKKTILIYQSARQENRPVSWSEINADSANMINSISSALNSLAPPNIVGVCLQQAKEHTEALVAELAGATEAARQEAETIRKQLEEEFLSRNSTSIKHISEADGDKAAPPFPTTEALLQAQRHEHFQRFVATEKTRNETHAVRKQVKQLQTRTTPAVADPENSSALANGAVPDEQLNAIQQLQRLEVDLAAEQAALQTARIVGDKLASYKELYEKDMKALEGKKVRISELDDSLQANQKLVDILMKQNAAARAQLSSLLRNIRRAQTLQSTELNAFVRECCKQLKGANISETRHLMETPLTAVARIPDSLERYSDLSINGSHRLEPIASSLFDSSLNVGSLSSEEFLLDLRRLIWETDRMETELRQRKESMDKTGLSKMQMDAAAEVLAAIDKTEAEQLSGWTPVLDSQTDQTKKVIEVCHTLEDMVADWWEQPAQHLAPWVQVDGKSLQHYIAKWREVNQTS